MSKKFIDDQIFDKIAISQLDPGDYENCKFINSDLSNCDLSYRNFSQCEFIDCNLSLVKLSNTSFREVHFKKCKLLGCHFENCNEFLFTVTYEDCILNLSSFYKHKLKNISIKNCSLHEVDFTNVDLTGAIFENCDFSGAIFENSILEKADFRSSIHYSINPEINRIKKAKFSISGIIGLLGKYEIEID